MAETSEAAKAQPANKSNTLLLVMVMVMSLAGTGTAVFFALRPPKTEKAAPAHAETPAPPAVGQLVEMPALVVNLNHPMEEIRYLKSALALEVADEKVAE